MIQLTRFKKTTGISFWLAVFCLVASAPTVFARENVDYWYLKDFQSEIIVNKDSSVAITEKIIADCGRGINKHGIFRILPTEIKTTDGKKTKMPVELISITDFSGRPLKYTTTKSSFEKTITWKIGDPDITVRGENGYLIKYRVQNVIRFFNNDFDEFYWNLNGNFWNLETDNFRARIKFPSEVNLNNSEVEYYTGSLGSKSKDLSVYSWESPNVLTFRSTQVLLAGQGITASVIFPKGIFAPYRPGFWDIYGNYFSLLIPLLALILSFYLWNKHGRDPKISRTVIAEYDAPENLSPIELGALKTNGWLNNEFITAEIVNLAVKGYIIIKEINKRILIFDSRDFEISRTDLPAEGLNMAQLAVLKNIFGNRQIVKISELKNKFYKYLKGIKEKTIYLLAEKGLIFKLALRWKMSFIIISVPMFVLGVIIFGNNYFWGTAFFAAGIIILTFGFLMPKRTIKGAEANWKIKGFKLYMETAEKYRQQFYEKENIFEKFLPYAIVFGMTSEWVKKMKEIYGEDFYANYHPVWYAGSVAAFNIQSLTSTIDSLSSAIAANTSSPSGSGGGGSAGGGGGGGGGGGW